MSKIILNSCYGGYAWSNRALVDYLEKKGYRDIQFDTYSAGGREGRFVPEISNITVNGEPFYDWNIDRKDPIAIQLLEEEGSAYCSGTFASLRIEEYNEEDYIPDIDEYDGIESLKLIPKITEKRIRDCKSIDEVVSLLGRLGVFVQEDNDGLV